MSKSHSSAVLVAREAVEIGGLVPSCSRALHLNADGNGAFFHLCARAHGLAPQLGIRASSTVSLIFDNVRLPPTAVLGECGDGFKIAMKTLDAGRIGIAAQALGIARAAFECAIAYAQTRTTMGAPIARHQLIQVSMPARLLGLGWCGI